MNSYLKLTTTAIVVLLVSIKAWAYQQPTYTVVDSKTKAPIEFATVLLTYDTKQISNSLTDMKGRFQLDLTKGDSVTVSHLAYQMAKIAVVGISDTIEMSVNSSILDEIEVSASAASSSIDKDSYIITNEIKRGTSKADDVLDRIEGVSINKYSNSISVDNSSSVLVMVNGLKKDQSYIRNLDPNKIKSVEVIRNITGKYATEYDAIINVVLKDNITGYDINLSSETLFNFGHMKRDSTLYQIDNSADFNFTKNRLSLYGTLGNRVENFISIPVSQDITIAPSYTFNSSPGEELASQKSNNSRITLGGDYSISKDHTVSLESNYSVMPEGDLNSNNSEFNTVVKEDGDIIDSYNDRYSSSSDSRTSNSTLFYRGKLSDRLSVSSDITYSNYSSNSRSSIINSNSPEEYYELSSNSKIYYELSADFNYEISSRWNIEGGFSYFDKEDSSDFGTGSSSETSNQVKTKRTKSYIYSGSKIDNKQSIKMGLLFEHFNSSSSSNNEITNDQTVVLPYLNYIYKITKKQEINLTYKAYPRYPSISNLMPNRSKVDQTSYVTGNPNLTSTWQHSIAARFTILGEKLRIKPYLNITNNNISKYGKVENGIIEYNYDNIGRRETMGVDISSNLNLSKNFIFSNSLNIYQDRFTTDDRTILESGENRVKDWKLSSQLIYINHRSGLVAGLNYDKKLAKSAQLQGYSAYNNSYLLALIQKSFAKGRLNATLLHMLPVDGMGIDYNQVDVYRGINYSSETTTGLSSVLKNLTILQLSFRFGKNFDKVKKLNLNKSYEQEQTKGIM